MDSIDWKSKMLENIEVTLDKLDETEYATLEKQKTQVTPFVLDIDLKTDNTLTAEVEIPPDILPPVETEEELQARRQKEHRLRQKNLFLETGISGWSEHHVLEMALFFAIPQGDTKNLAWDLLDKFGTLKNVLDASVEELESVSGVGHHCACLLKFFPSMSAVYLGFGSKVDLVILTSYDAFSVLQPYFLDASREKVVLLCLDGRHNMITTRNLGEGGEMSAILDVRRVATEALTLKTVYCYLAHNHVNSSTVPSQEDWEATGYLMTILDGLNIYLLDHLIISGREMTSMKELQGKQDYGLTW